MSWCQSNRNCCDFHVMHPAVLKVFQRNWHLGGNVEEKLSSCCKQEKCKSLLLLQQQTEKAIQEHLLEAFTL